MQVHFSIVSMPSLCVSQCMISIVSPREDLPEVNGVDHQSSSDTKSFTILLSVEMLLCIHSLLNHLRVVCFECVASLGFPKRLVSSSPVMQLYEI
jgi:hypothetical protein